MDTSVQLYESEATGWQRGLYDDVQATFRAPVVNWIFRTLVANEPTFTRYLWAQLKPHFETQACGEACRAYRVAVTEPFFEGDEQVPTYRATDLDLPPWEWRELQGQLRTFDTVVPRLALMFELVYQSFHEGDVGGSPRTDAAATTPLPEWLDGDSGLSPTMAAFDEPSDAVAETVAAVQAFHGFDEGLPSIYRCLVQWPDAFETLWSDLEPSLSSAAFDEACAAGRAVVTDFVESVPSAPQLQPAALREAGFDAETVASMENLFDDFARGPVETVLPAVPVVAATVGASDVR